MFDLGLGSFNNVPGDSLTSGSFNNMVINFEGVQAGQFVALFSTEIDFGGPVLNDAYFGGYATKTFVDRGTIVIVGVFAYKPNKLFKFYYKWDANMGSSVMNLSK